METRNFVICLFTFFLTITCGFITSVPEFASSTNTELLRVESEGKNVELLCPVNTKPPPLIQWSINGVPLHELEISARRLLLNGGRVLRIHDLHHDLDTGLYQCNASNFYGHVATAVFLKVQSFAPIFRMPDHRIWKAIRHTTVNFDCTVDAAPEPDVRWVDASDSPIISVPEKVEIFQNATLRIFDVSNADEGYYYCNVSNKYGINRAMNKLKVYSATYFAEVPSPKHVVIDAGGRVEYRCRAKTDPRLTVTYLWTQNEKMLNASLEPSGASVLLLDKVRGNSSGKIECVAVTDVDVKRADTILVVRDVPAAPQLLKVECEYIAQQRALIVWKKPNENGASITHFSLEKSDSFHPDKWEQIYIERNLDRDVFKLILPLSPWMNYTFRVTAHNIFGSSRAAYSAENVCMTHEDVPHKNPQNVNAFGTEPGNLVITWHPMEKRDWNAPKLRYLVRYRSHLRNEIIPNKTQTKMIYDIHNNSKQITMDEVSSWKPSIYQNYEWREFFVEDPLLNETVIRDLPIFTPFEVQIRAVNRKGYSAIPPSTYVGYSGEDVPELAPKNLRLVGFANFSTAYLTWDPVPVKSLRGNFNGYKVKYWLTKRPYLSSNIFTDNHTLQSELIGLNAMHNYSAQVFALNGRYESVPSNLLHFATPEGIPSKVHNLRVFAVGARSIYVTWEPPLHPNGNLRGYFLAFENSTSNNVEETYVLYRQQYYLHEFLEPDSPYRVAVWAETNGGEGPRVIRSTRTWHLRNPDPPNFIVHVSSPFSANVEWLLPEENSTRSHFSGTNFYIKYRKSDEEFWHKSDLVVLPYTSLEIVNLTENTDYDIVGIVHEGVDLFTESELPVQIRTDSRQTSNVINAERLQSAAWFLMILITLALVLIVISLICCITHQRYGFGSGLYEIHIRDKNFRRYEIIDQARCGRESLQSGSSGTVSTEVAFLDDTSDTHHRFVAASAKNIVSVQNSAKRRVKEKVAEIEKCGNILPPYIVTPTAVHPRFHSKTSFLTPKFRNDPVNVNNKKEVNVNNLRVRVPQKPTVKLPQIIDDRHSPTNILEEPISNQDVVNKNKNLIKYSDNDAKHSTNTITKLDERTRIIGDDLIQIENSPSHSTTSKSDVIKLNYEYTNADTLPMSDKNP